MFNRKFPYTDMHDLNLDWVMQKVKELEALVRNVNITVDSTLSTSSYNPIANAPVATAINTVNASLTEQATGITRLRTAVAELATDVTELQSTASDQASDISELQTTAAEQASDISELQTTAAQHDVQLALLTSGFNEIVWTYHSLGYYTSESITPTRDTTVTIHINSGYSVLVIPPGESAPYYAASDEPETLSAGSTYVFRIESSDTSATLATILQNVYVTNCVDQIDSKQDAMTYITSTATSYTLMENQFVDFGEQTTLTITCPTSGLYCFAFTSGTTATTLTLDGITMPDDFTVEASKRYEINILNGYGVAQAWTVS